MLECYSEGSVVSGQARESSPGPRMGRLGRIDLSYKSVMDKESLIMRKYLPMNPIS